MLTYYLLSLEPLYQFGSQYVSVVGVTDIPCFLMEPLSKALCSCFTCVIFQLLFSLTFQALPSFLKSRLTVVGSNWPLLQKVIKPQALPLDLYGRKDESPCAWLDTRIEAMTDATDVHHPMTSLELLKMCLDPKWEQSPTLR